MLPRQRQDLLQQEPRIRVAQRVILHRSVGGRGWPAVRPLPRSLTRGQWLVARAHEDRRHHRQLLAVDQVVQHHRHPPSPFPRGKPRAILENHQRARLRAIIARRDVERPLPRHPRIRFGSFHLEIHHLPLRHPRLRLRIRPQHILCVGVNGCRGFRCRGLGNDVGGPLQGESY